jgi:hypothetical protein
MKALEFRASMSENATLSVPPEVAAQIKPDRPVRVLVLLPECNEDSDWSDLTATQFLKGYDDLDAIYDHLPAR